MYALVLAKVEGGIGDAEAVLIVTETDLTTTVEHHIDRPTDGGAHQLVMDLQVTEPEGDLSERVDIGRVKHRVTISTSEDEATVRELARGTVAELVTSQAISLIKRGDTSCLCIEAVQTFHRTDPEMALMSYFDAGHVRAGETSDMRHRVCFRIVAQKSVTYGAYPHVAIGILIHIGWDVNTSMDAFLHIGNLEGRQLTCLGVHPHDVLIEGGDKHRAVVELL